MAHLRTGRREKGIGVEREGKKKESSNCHFSGPGVFIDPGFTGSDKHIGRTPEPVWNPFSPLTQRGSRPRVPPQPRNGGCGAAPSSITAFVAVRRAEVRPRRRGSRPRMTLGSLSSEDRPQPRVLGGVPDPYQPSPSVFGAVPIRSTKKKRNETGTHRGHSGAGGWEQSGGRLEGVKPVRESTELGFGWSVGRPYGGTARSCRDYRS